MVSSKMERTTIRGIDETDLLKMAFTSIEWCKTFKKEVLHNERALKKRGLEDKTTSKTVQPPSIKP